MKLFLPNNIYTSFLIGHIPAEVELLYRPSSLLTLELEKNTDAIALVPSLDLLKNRNLIVSSRLAVSFDGLLSNAYFYFIEGEKKLEKILLRGDVSVNEFVLAKILFEERYSSDVELVFDTKNEIEANKDYIICGDDNLNDNLYKKGISLSEDVADTIDLPYVNYLFVSPDREALKKFQSLFADLDVKIENSAESRLDLQNINYDTKEFILANMNSVYFEMTENEKDALNELIKLVYYKGMIDDIIEIKYVD